jgi:hypothetical protein
MSGPRLFPRRGTDRVESAAELVLGILAGVLVLVSVWSGFAAHTQVVEESAVENAAWTPVTATLLEDAPSLVAGPSTGQEMTVADARWTAPDGTVHTGAVPVPTGVTAGSETPIWVDHTGAVAPRPLTASDALIFGALTAVGIAVVGGFLLLFCLLAVRKVTGVLNARRWERGWALFGPEWTRTHR